MTTFEWFQEWLSYTDLTVKYNFSIVKSLEKIKISKLEVRLIKELCFLLIALVVIIRKNKFIKSNKKLRIINN